MFYHSSFLKFEEPRKRAIHDDTRAPPGPGTPWGLGAPGAPHIRAGRGSQGPSDSPARTWAAGRHWDSLSPGHWAPPWGKAWAKAGMDY